MSMKLVTELEKLREFLHGAHLATNDDNAGALLHMACHKVDDLIKLVDKDSNELRQEA
jgi:hypothetical protein